jgi:hypothetical protein
MKEAIWKLKWWWRWFLADNDAPLRERRRRFHALTGLHPCYVQNRFVADDEVIAIQARRIRGLELQLNQQRKGYQRKIARLERSVAAPKPDSQHTEGEG